MASEIEFVTFKDFVAGLSETENPTDSDKSIVSNDIDGPRSAPSSESALTSTATKDDLVSGNYVRAKTPTGWIKMPLNLFESVKFMHIESNDEYVYAVVDGDSRILFGVKKDGTFGWQKGIPNHVKSFVLSYVNNLIAEIDGKADKVEGKSLIDSNYAEAQSSVESAEFLKVITDFSDRMVEAIDKFGRHLFFVKPQFKAGVEWSEQNLTELEIALKENGFTGGQGDWSDSKSLSVGKPRIAIVDFSGISSMPTTKTQNLNGIMRFWDLDGNYFKKKVIMNAQGNSSLALPKKNISIDILNEDDSSFELRIGSWVTQDSFHLKAFYHDFSKVVPTTCYNLYEAILNTRGFFADKTWKKALINENAVTAGEGLGYKPVEDFSLRIDTGARCFPDGFPCLVYLNGAFYGMFIFQLKKHRDNYHMDKDNKFHIHMDSDVNMAFFGGDIDWSGFEIRAPKTLYCMDGNKYDGDSPAEIAGGDQVAAWISAGQLPDGTPITSKIEKALNNTAYVKNALVALSTSTQRIDAAVTDSAKKEIFNETFDLDNLIDYQIFSDVVNNVDGFNKNCQWTTWDGVKWFANAYDLDSCFGLAGALGTYVRTPATQHLPGYSDVFPTSKMISLYQSELEARYAFLRSKKVIDAERIMDDLNRLMKDFGIDNYKLEYEKWPDAPVNNTLTINSDYWDIVTDNDGNAVIVYSSSGYYDENAIYSVNDEVVFNGAQSVGWYYKFKCKQSCQGEVPAEIAYMDNVWRYYKWLVQSISNMDSVYNYNGD